MTLSHDFNDFKRCILFLLPISRKGVKRWTPRRVPGLPIRDCAQSCNNCVHTPAQMSAMGEEMNTFFERLY